jgi:hypothetical protein
MIASRHHNPWAAEERSACLPDMDAHLYNPGDAMEIVLGVLGAVGRATEAVFAYVESHHWIFGFVLIAYLFYLHDRSLHARFDALDKRIDEVRRRLAIDY